MPLTGVFGAYFLALDLVKTRKAAFLGASFYLLNIATVQNFYVTFEPFAAFFAFLPWLLWSLMRYLDKSSRKNLLLFSLFSLFGTTFAYVQTISVVYLLILLVILLSFVIRNKRTLVRSWLVVARVVVVVLLTNAFWLLPVAYFTLVNSGVPVTAKGNLMSTEVTFLQNNRFGNFFDLATMRGYWFAYTDFDQWGNSVYLLDAWKSHFYQLPVIILSWFYFLLMLAGLVTLFVKKQSLYLQKNRSALVVVFGLVVFILLGSNPPFGFFYEFLRENVPLFGQIFRSSFTKWVVPFSLFYSLLLTFGLAFVFTWLKRWFWQWLLGLAFFASLIFYAWPAFQGHFFYERLRVEIPEAYFELFDYFKYQAPASSRIANLPQHTFYGWQWNDWGYRGSGFLWYGIKQPILDRAFDVWSAPLEGYYWELQHALDQKDVKMLEAVFSKYDVDYVLLDSSIVNRNTAKPFNYAALSDLLAQSTRLKLITQFDFLSLYAFEDDENSREKEFLSVYENLPTIANSYKHSWRDQAYLDFHDYLSEPNNFATNASIIYPFSSLFTNHLQKGLEFTLEEDEGYFYLEPKQALSDRDGFAVVLPDLLEVEEALPFRLSWQLEGQQLRLTLQALLPEIYYQGQKHYYDFTQELLLDAALCQLSEDCYLNLNNQLLTEFSQSGSQEVLLQTSQPNTLALSTALRIEYFSYAFFDLSRFELVPRVLSQTDEESLLIRVPKINLFGNLLESELNLEQAKTCRPLEQGSYFKEKRPDGNFYQATGTNVCDHFYLPDLAHRQAYLFRLEAESWRSLPFTFAIQAESLGRSPLETYLSEGLNYQILPPTENFNQGYTLYLSTDSYGREVNENFLQSAEVFTWPYEFLSRLQLRASEELPLAAAPKTCDFAVKKRALWLYRLDLPADCQADYVKLSQAFDQGWLAISDGQFLAHSKINNWANAWQLPEDLSQDQIIYIFFWPQLLQYFGFGILFALPCFFLLKMR